MLRSLPVDKASILRQNGIMIDAIATIVPPTGGDKLLPGASVLPASIGSKLTIKNALIAAGVAVAGYVGYALLFPKKKASTPAAAVAGLFGTRRRRRRR